MNGFKGIDLNADSLSIEDVRNLVVALLKEGVTTFLPSIITNNPEVIARNMAIINEAIQNDPLAKQCIPGIHLEGPFLSKAEGAKGAHPAEWIREPDLRLLDRWNEMAGHKIRLITISPVYPGTDAFISACIRRNIHVALGHTDASREQILNAVQAGASLSTHLGNGLPRMIHRHQNPMFAQLGSDELYTSVIADGHHLSEDLLKIIIRTKPGKTILVSDATSFAGMDPGIYEAPIGGKVALDKSKRLAIYNKEEYLAGSASSLLDCVDYLAASSFCTLEDAWKMASLVPLEYLFRDSNIPAHFQRDRVVGYFEKDRFEILYTEKDDRQFASY